MTRRLSDTEKSWALLSSDQRQLEQRRAAHCARIAAIYAAGGYLAVAVIRPGDTCIHYGRRLAMSEAANLPDDALEDR